MASYTVSFHEQVDAGSFTEAASLAFFRLKNKRTDTVEAGVRNGDTFRSVALPPTAALAVLTDQESNVARLVMEGCSNPAIAKTLGITERTVKAHMGHIFDKFGISSRVRLATALIRMEQAARERREYANL